MKNEITSGVPGDGYCEINSNADLSHFYLNKDLCPNGAESDILARYQWILRGVGWYKIKKPDFSGLSK